MEKGLYSKYLKSNYNIDDFGRGKSRTSKARNRRKLKKQAKRRIYKELDYD